MADLRGPKIAKTMTGSRALVYVDSALVGIFESCSWSVNVSVEPIHLLGRYSPDEIVPVAYEAVTLNCSGFRVMQKGAHTIPKFPKLDDLLKLESLTITVVDRQSELTMLTASNCVPTSYTGNVNAKATSRITITYTGTVVHDEEGAQAETGNGLAIPTLS